MTAEINYHVNPTITNEVLNALFVVAWPEHSERDFIPILQRSLAYIGAYHETRLVGYVNVAWDGGIHTFLLDTTVHPDYQRRGIGAQLVRTAIDAARAKGVKWMEVDYEPHLEQFYRTCGFRPTLAGLLDLVKTSG
jgi:GNAT superfamily N-acetyltransferase